MIFIIKGRKEQRALHWNEIRKRVTTHEGEFLCGDKGKAYQNKYSKKYLGKDLSNTPPITIDKVEYYEKFKK